MTTLLSIRSEFAKEAFWIFSIADVLQMAIIAVIYYVVLQKIKRRDAKLLWLASGGLWIVYFIITPFFGFSTLHSFSLFINSGLLTLMGIVYFDDLRIWLLSFGKENQKKGANQLKGFTGKIPQHAIRELTSAIDRMKQTRTGALIVIPDTDDASMYMNDEIDIKGVVTEELLLSIFNPKSPLHDGATVISKDRVVSARNILPVTKDESKTDYGTRHRAAIGLSEMCDAMVLVVSEERGALSICHGGQIRTLEEGNWQEELRSWLV